jgi:hypothetical protein
MVNLTRAATDAIRSYESRQMARVGVHPCVKRGRGVFSVAKRVSRTSGLPEKISAATPKKTPPERRGSNPQHIF